MAKATAISGTLMVAAAMFLLAVHPVYAQEAPVGAPGPSMVPVVPGPSSSAAPSPGLDCFTYLVNMSDCLTYVEAGSNLTKPEKKCCPELAGLVESQPVCLCQLLGNPEKVGIAIDLSKALKLPSLCKVNTPDVSVCAAIGVPVGVPTASEPAGSMSPKGLASSPASGEKSNGQRSIETSLLCFIVGLATVIATAFF